MSRSCRVLGSVGLAVVHSVDGRLQSAILFAFQLEFANLIFHDLRGEIKRKKKADRNAHLSDRKLVKELPDLAWQFLGLRSEFTEFMKSSTRTWTEFQNLKNLAHLLARGRI